MGKKVKQQDIKDCGAACLSSIASHFKLHIPIARIRQYAGTDKKGTSLFGLIQAAEKLGFTAKGVKGGLDALPDIPLPAIAHVIIGEQQLHHYVVIYKVQQEKVTIMNPATGTLDTYTKDEFNKLWTGVLMLIQPAEQFVTGNHKTSIWRRFFQLIKPHSSIIIQALFGAIIYTVLGLSTSIYIQKITDNVLIEGNTNLLNLLSIAMIVILLLQIFLSSMKSIMVLKTGQLIDVNLILGYYQHLMKLPQRFFDTMQVGEITSRISDAVKIRSFINDIAINIIVNIL